MRHDKSILITTGDPLQTCTLERRMYLNEFTFIFNVFAARLISLAIQHFVLHGVFKVDTHGNLFMMMQHIGTQWKL